MTQQTIDIPAEPVPQTQAVAVRETGGALGRALSLEQITERLDFIRRVMKDVMKEDQDYGKIPGTGQKPTLLQPGAQKLLMTFNLREQLKKETLREYPNWHREYEITVTVFPAGQSPESGWDGVGTCSTLESKYRYRKAERRCPECGHNTIIQGKAEYGGGWVCFKKKGGCGAKFGENDTQITSQPAGTTENEDPADQWNTVRKMAFKRALVAAAINATNTSELWTQDLEDMRSNAETRQAAPQSATTKTPGKTTAEPGKPQSGAKARNGGGVPFPTEKTRAWMFSELRKNSSQDFILAFFSATGIIMPNEGESDFPLRWVANSRAQIEALQDAMAVFGETGDGKMPYPAKEEPTPAKESKKPIEVPRDKPKPHFVAMDGQPDRKDPEWWRNILVTVPRKGSKRAEYLKNPDTIGSLYQQVHEQTADGQDARQRLWGLLNNWQPSPWKKSNGEEVPPSDADLLFREALDAFAAWHEKNKPDEKL